LQDFRGASHKVETRLESLAAKSNSLNLRLTSVFKQTLEDHASGADVDRSGVTCPLIFASKFLKAASIATSLAASLTECSLAIDWDLTGAGAPSPSFAADAALLKSLKLPRSGEEIETGKLLRAEESRFVVMDKDIASSKPISRLGFTSSWSWEQQRRCRRRGTSQLCHPFVMCSQQINGIRQIESVTWLLNTSNCSTASLCMG
jgi:hypothetical protein